MHLYEFSWCFCGDDAACSAGWTVIRRLCVNCLNTDSTSASSSNSTRQILVYSKKNTPGLLPRGVCLSVCPPATSRCSTKAAKHRITQTTPHDTYRDQVFWCQRSRRNSNVVTSPPRRGRQMPHTTCHNVNANLTNVLSNYFLTIFNHALLGITNPKSVWQHWTIFILLLWKRFMKKTAHNKVHEGNSHLTNVISHIYVDIYSWL